MIQVIQRLPGGGIGLNRVIKSSVTHEQKQQAKKILKEVFGKNWHKHIVETSRDGNVYFDLKIIGKIRLPLFILKPERENSNGIFTYIHLDNSSITRFFGKKNIDAILDGRRKQFVNTLFIPLEQSKAKLMANMNTEQLHTAIKNSSKVQEYSVEERLFAYKLLLGKLDASYESLVLNK